MCEWTGRGADKSVDSQAAEAYRRRLQLFEQVSDSSVHRAADSVFQIDAHYSLRVGFYSDGSLYVAPGFLEPALIQKAHENGVKVLLASAAPLVTLMTTRVR